MVENCCGPDCRKSGVKPSQTLNLLGGPTGQRNQSQSYELIHPPCRRPRLSFSKTTGWIVQRRRLWHFSSLVKHKLNYYSLSWRARNCNGQSTPWRWNSDLSQGCRKGRKEFLLWATALHRKCDSKWLTDSLETHVPPARSNVLVRGTWKRGTTRGCPPEVIYWTCSITINCGRLLKSSKVIVLATGTEKDYKYLKCFEVK